MATEDELKTAYFAGIIDGEGSVYIRPARPKQAAHAIVRVNMTCQRTVQALADFFGGKCLPKKLYPGLKQQWTWELYGKKAQDAIRKIQPFLITKSANADLCLAI